MTTEGDTPAIDTGSQLASAGFLGGLSGVSKMLLLASILFIVIGGGLQIYGRMSRPAPVAQASAAKAPDLGVGLAPSQDGGHESAEASVEQEGEPTSLERWSPTITRMGFSFFVCFVIGFAVRAFVRLVLLFTGLLFLILFGLDSIDLITVNVDEMKQMYDNLVPWLKTQTTSFAAFIQGYLPSAGTATAGLIAGFRKG